MLHTLITWYSIKKKKERENRVYWSFTHTFHSQILNKKIEQSCHLNHLVPTHLLFFPLLILAGCRGISRDAVLWCQPLCHPRQASNPVPPWHSAGEKDPWGGQPVTWEHQLNNMDSLSPLSPTCSNSLKCFLTLFIITVSERVQIQVHCIHFGSRTGSGLLKRNFEIMFLVIL